MLTDWQFLRFVYTGWCSICLFGVSSAKYRLFNDHSQPSQHLSLIARWNTRESELPRAFTKYSTLTIFSAGRTLRATNNFQTLWAVFKVTSDCRDRERICQALRHYNYVALQPTKPWHQSPVAPSVKSLPR